MYNFSVYYSTLFIFKNIFLNLELIIELYADKMFINAENIVVDGEKYILP